MDGFILLQINLETILNHTQKLLPFHTIPHNYFPSHLGLVSLKPAFYFFQLQLFKFNISVLIKEISK